MTITVSDKQTGTEINLGPSEASPGKVNVTIFAKTPDDVQRTIQDLADEYNHVSFTNPARCADGKWGSMGRVWNEPMEDFGNVEEYP